MRSRNSLMTGVLLSLAAPSLAQAAPAPAPPMAAAPRAPRAPRAPVAPPAPVRSHDHAQPPAPPEPPEAPTAWTMSVGHSKARLGTQVSSMTGELRVFFGAPADAGLLVQHIEPGSAAEAAKLAVGDVLVEVDGQRVDRVSDVRDALSDRSKGDVVEVVVVRKKSRKKLKATLADAGPTAFTVPALPSFELPSFELPEEARRFMSPEDQRELEQALDEAREQLRAVEHELRTHEPRAAPTPPTAPVAPKAKRGRSGKR